jgi:hypothetical protein
VWSNADSMLSVLRGELIASSMSESSVGSCRPFPLSILGNGKGGDLDMSVKRRGLGLIGAVGRE